MDPVYTQSGRANPQTGSSLKRKRIGIDRFIHQISGYLDKNELMADKSRCNSRCKDIIGRLFHLILFS
jgi:hypothetical protein